MKINVIFRNGHPILACNGATSVVDMQVKMENIRQRLLAQCKGNPLAQVFINYEEVEYESDAKK